MPEQMKLPLQRARSGFGSVETKVSFEVTVSGTDVGPDWAEKIEEKLVDEMELRFGKRIEVKLAGVETAPVVHGGFAE